MKHLMLPRAVMQIVFLLLTLLSMRVSFAQPTVVRGRVTDAGTKEPIVAASVYFKGAKGVTTDSLGRFEIRTTGNQKQLEVSYIGYKTQTVAIEVGKKQSIDVQLSPAAQRFKCGSD